MTSKMSARVSGDLNVFKDKIKNFIRYEKDNMTTVKEVFEGRNKIHSEFQKQGSPSFTSNSMRIQGIRFKYQGSNV